MATKFKSNIYGMIGNSLIEVRIGQDPETELWGYQVYNLSGHGNANLMGAGGYETEREVVLGLYGSAPQRGISLNPAVEGPQGPDYRERRRLFGEMIERLAESDHPATAFLRRSYHDAPLLGALYQNFKKVRNGGPDTIEDLFCAVGGSIAGLAVAMFADANTLGAILNANYEDVQVNVSNKAAEYLWLTEEQAQAIFLQQQFSAPFESRLRKGQVDYASALKVWNHFVKTGDPCWELAFPKSPDMLRNMVTTTAQSQFAILCRTEGLNEDEINAEAENMKALVRDALSYLEQSDLVVFDCHVSRDEVRVLAETRPGRIEWQVAA